jgi:septal ring factor EnvC (AmiA/AmiB activator)
MEARTKGLLTLFGVMTAAIIALVIALAWQQHVHANQVVALQNQLAEKDKTLEIQKGLYTKLTEQTKNIQGTLDSRDTQVKELEDQVKKAKQQLLDATQLVITWKKNYEGLAKATQTPVPIDPKNPPTNPIEIAKGREKVDFHEDFGYIKVDG